jgi:hypothetical protein
MLILRLIAEADDLSAKMALVLYKARSQLLAGLLVSHEQQKLTPILIASKTTSQTIAATAPTLTFLNILDIFPKEIRRKIYLAYFQIPEGHFVHPEEQELFKPILALRATQRDLYDEILNVFRYIPSTPQTIKLESCYDQANWLWLGFPKRTMSLGEWSSLHYLVINIKIVDVSNREANGACPIIRLGMSQSTRDNLDEVFAMEENNTALGNLKQIRFDFEYGDENSESQSKHAVELATLVYIWPDAVSVWAEAVGKIMNPYLLEAVRGFNFARHAMKVYPIGTDCPDLNQLDGMAAWVGNETTVATRKGTNYNPVAVWDEQYGLAFDECEQYWARVGADMVIRCPGCFAELKSKRSVEKYPEEEYLTKILWKQHLERAILNGGALACEDKEKGKKKCRECREGEKEEAGKKEDEREEGERKIEEL